MAAHRPTGRVRLIYRRSSTLVKSIVLAALLLSTLARLVLRLAILDAKEQLEQQRNDAAALEQDNQDLSRAISQLGTVQSVEELAGKLLGLVDPDTIIFLPEE